MNEPPAGRNTRNYRPDQRPHVARPGQQRDPGFFEKGSKEGSRPAAGTGLQGPPFPVRPARPRGPLPHRGLNFPRESPPLPATTGGGGLVGRRAPPAPSPRRSARAPTLRARSPARCRARALSAAPAGAPPPASPAARPLTPPPAARTRTSLPSRARLPPPRPPPRPQPGTPRRAPTRSRAHAPRPRALPSPPRSRGRRAALLLLSPPSRMVAAAAAATQTLGSGGRAPRPEVTFLAASARAAPPSPSYPPSGLHPVLAALGRRARRPPRRRPPSSMVRSGRLREPLPDASRTRVLRPRSMAPR